MEINFNENRYRKFNIPKTIEKIKKSVINYIFLDWMFGIPNIKLRKGNYMKEKSKIKRSGNW